MAYEPKPNTGSLFRNQKREKDTHPWYTGSALVICPHCQQQQDYWLDAWMKVREKEERWLSISIKPKIARKAVSALEQPRGKMKDDDDYPF